MVAHHPPLSHVLAPVSLSSHCLPTLLGPALHRPRSLCSHVWIISCQIFDLPELSSPHPPRNFQSPLVQLDCPLLLCIHQAEFKWPVLEAVSAHYAHLYSRVSLLYHLRGLLSHEYLVWTCISLGQPNLGKLPSPNPSTISAVSVLLLINPLLQPPQIACIHSGLYVNLAILFKICRGLGRDLSALLSPPPWLPRFPSLLSPLSSADQSCSCFMQSSFNFSEISGTGNVQSP